MEEAEATLDLETTDKNRMERGISQEEAGNHEIRTRNYQYSFNLKLLFRLILCCGMVQRCWLRVSTQGTNTLHLRLNLLSISCPME